MTYNEASNELRTCITDIKTILVRDDYTSGDAIYINAKAAIAICAALERLTYAISDLAPK